LAVESYAGINEEATIKVWRISSEVHTSGVHTPQLGSTHQSNESHPIQLPTLICDVGPTIFYPHISTAIARLTHSRREEGKEKYI
jgi:hypothetical protein